VFEKYQMAYIRYQGEISVDDILVCIKKQYQVPALKGMHKRLVDFRDARVIQVSAGYIETESARIRQELNKLQSDNSLEAIISATPEETAFFFLYAEASKRNKKAAKCFSTLSGALQYLDVEMSNDEQNSIQDHMTCDVC
jgi:hypothetical protein